MPRQLTCLRIFIASPGGLMEERKAFRDEVLSYNETDAIHRGVYFQPVGWEDTLGGVGRPQALINEEVRSCDYFFLLLWDRWGSRPNVGRSGYSSGTEEEYHVAMECHKNDQAPMRQLVIFFKAVSPQQLSDPGRHLRRVLKFKRSIERQKNHLFHTFDTVESFRLLIRRHLASWLRGEESGEDASRLDPSPIGPQEGFILPPASLEQVTEIVDATRIQKAWKYANEGRLTEAEVEFARAITGRAEPEPLIEYGRFLTRVGRLEQAKVYLEGAVSIAQDQNKPRALALAYAHLVIVLRIRGDLKGAEETSQTALTIWEKLGSQDGMAVTYGQLGDLALIRGDINTAERMHRRAVELFEKVGNDLGLAGAMRNLGEVLKDRGQLDQAESLYRRSLEIEQKHINLEGLAHTHGVLGELLLARGDLEGAESEMRKSLAINESLGRVIGQAAQLGNLGGLLMSRNDLDGAEGMYRRSLELQQQLGRLDGIAICYYNLASVLQDRGQLDDAEEMYRKSLEIHQRMGNAQGLADGYSAMANVFLERNDPEAAEYLYGEALGIYESLDSPEDIARVSRNLGFILKARGQLREAQRMFSRALEVGQKVGDSPAIQRANNLIDSALKKLD